MKPLFFLWRPVQHILCLWLLAGSTLWAIAAPAALPSDSIYQLVMPLTNQDGQTFRLDVRRGQPMVVSMFYTSCQFVCPMLIDTLRDTTDKLSESDRTRLKVLMVTIDPQRDSVAVLKKTADERALDTRRWTLAHSDAATTRKLAAVLGIQYRAISGGDFNHTTALILIDADGRIVGRSTRLGTADPAFVKLVRASLLQAPH